MVKVITVNVQVHTRACVVWVQPWRKVWKCKYMQAGKQLDLRIFETGLAEIIAGSLPSPKSQYLGGKQILPVYYVTTILGWLV
jgi:hypothetical protein